MGKAMWVLAAGVAAVTVSGCDAPWNLFGGSEPPPHTAPTTSLPPVTTAPPATTAPQGPTPPQGATAPPTTAAALPQVDTMPGGQFTPAVKPSSLYLSGDSGNIVTGLRWAGWDARGATGYGTVDVQGCVPNCAQGSNTPTPVTIYLNKPVNGVFTLLTEEIKGQPAQNITLPSS